MNTLALLLAPLALPQSVVQVVPPPSGGIEWGRGVVVVDDMNADGIPDIVFGGRLPGGSGNGALVSGADGTEIRNLLTFGGTSFRFGLEIVALDDIDGDGFQDVAFGDSEGSDAMGRVTGVTWIVSTGTGALLSRIDGPLVSDRFGESLTLFRDVDGDGVRELLIGAPSRNQTPSDGRVHVASPVSGMILQSFDPVATSRFFGELVAGLSDLDGDGVEDFATYAVDLAQINLPRIEAYSGATSARLWATELSIPLFNNRLLRVPDMNGDGIDDVAVGSPFEPTNPSSRGAVRMLSGADGSVLWTLNESLERGEFGRSIAVVDDFDQDGVADVALTSSYAPNPFGGGANPRLGMLRVVSSVTGATIFNTYGVEQDDLNVPVRGWDVDGDGLDEILVSRRLRTASSTFGPGGGILVSYDPAPFGESVCAAQPNSVGSGALLSGNSPSNFAASASDTELTVRELPNRVFGYFLVSRQTTAPTPLGGSVGTLCLSPSMLGRDSANVLMSGPLGRVQYTPDLTTLPTPLGAIEAAAGDSIAFQFWYRDSATGGGATSNLSSAWRVTFR